MLVDLRHTALIVIEAVKSFAPETETDIHSRCGEWFSEELKKHSQDESRASSKYEKRQKFLQKARNIVTSEICNAKKSRDGRFG